MAIKKSELYSSLWKSCDELRGGMDASQYKDYVLILLFVKYVSDKYAGDKNAVIEIPKGGSFDDMVALKGNKEIGDGINKIIAKLATANELKGVIDVADFNDPDKLGKGKEMVDRLTNLVTIFQNESLNFSKNRADNDDILGDAYEYLMRHFATESGKSKGQFYTPSEVSRILAKVIGIGGAKSQDQTIYDPTCGSGSLLLKAADESGKGVTIYGQEMDNATAALAIMNMWLHDCPTAEIKKDNTLSNPLFKNEQGGLKTFDFAVANPPFSTKAWRSGFDPENDLYERFKGYGIPPAKNGDYAFLLHLIRSLKSKGKGAIILPHGVLFRGNVEAEIRKNIIKKGFIKGIIGLPANLFYGTGIPACIVVIDKENAESRRGIFMIDASKGFVKDGNKNRLREQDLHKIVDVFNKQLEIPKYSRRVHSKEIEEENKFNLNIPRYIDSQEEEDIQNIEAHLLGGIPNKDVDDLGNYWEVYPSLRKKLFAKTDCPQYSTLKVEKQEIKSTIFSHPEFVSYSEEIKGILTAWQKKHIPMLKKIAIKDKPKAIIFDLSEAILKSFSDRKLIDKYDVYQHLMTYWLEVMKDDVYMIVEDGWKAETYLVKDKNGKVKQEQWDCDLIPKYLVINRYFAKEQATIEQLESDRDEIVCLKEEMEEEHSGEEGLLEEVKNDKGNINKGEVKIRIKDIQKDRESAEELDVLEKYLGLIEKEAEANKAIKEALKELDEVVLKQYKKLTETEIKVLVVDDKWMMAIEKDVHSEIERIGQRGAYRIKELVNRYEIPLPQLLIRNNKIATKVKSHINKVGFKQDILDKLISPKEGWVEKKLGDTAVLKARIGWQGLTTAEYLDTGNYYLVTGTDFKDGYIDWDNCHYVDELRYKQDKYIQLKEHDVLVTKDGTIGKVALITQLEKPATLNSGVFVIRPINNAFHPEFFYFLLCSGVFTDFLVQLSAGSTINHLYQKDFVNFVYKTPATIEEQIIIAQILRDMDTQIELLEQQYNKYKVIKQGMMQELLTGKTRLV